MLEVRFLGSFAIHYNGKPVVLSSRAAQSLFAYLILTAGTQHRREKLAGMFWPDASEEKARTYLRQQLWRIRKELPVMTGKDYLLADDITICFNATSEYWLDVHVLENLDEAHSIEELKESLSVFQGELLPGFYDEWVAEEREHVQALLERGIARLLESLVQEKLWQETLEWAERWITLSRGPEAAYRYLMIAYEAIGDRARVASTYERCVQALHELDLEPSEETRSLAFKRSPKLHVPIPLTSFIGRKKELEEIIQLLTKSRLVTLTGSGGVGKTRLSLQVVDRLLGRFPDGIWFLDLAPLHNPAFLTNTLINLLKLRDTGEGELSTIELLVNFLQSRTCLIIFDNCEHLIDTCARLVSTLLESCEHLSILATSRESLRVSGEIPYRVPSLVLLRAESEHALKDLANTEAVQLFMERAESAQAGKKVPARDVVTVARICQRLDGIPLAIELAAARTGMLEPEQILQRLDDQFHLLTGGSRNVLPRHQTLRATIEWSYDLLSEKERILFQRLAVFAGGWTLEAAEEVCGGKDLEPHQVLDLLEQLLNKSLVIVETSKGGIRYLMLETIRQYGREKLLESIDAIPLQNRLLEYFLRRAEEIEPLLMGKDQSVWMDYLEQELDNIRSALDWAIVQNRGEESLRLNSALGWFWFIRCRFYEGEEWFKRVFAFREFVSKRTLAKSLRSGSWMYYAKDDVPTCLHYHRESLDLYRELGDEKEVSTTLQFMGVLEYHLGNLDQAKPLFEESLEISRRINNLAAMPRALMHLGYFAQEAGNIESARKYFEESLTVCRKVGEGHLMMVILGNMGNFMLSQGDTHKAREYYQEGLEIGIRLKNKRTIAQALLNFAQVLNAEGRYTESAQLQGFSESQFNELEALTEMHLSAIRRAADLPLEHMGEESYRREFETGKTLHQDQAVEIALGRTPG